MIFTEEMIKKLPIYEIPEDYDSMVNEMIEEAISDFDKAVERIDKEYGKHSIQAPFYWNAADKRS